MKTRIIATLLSIGIMSAQAGVNINSESLQALTPSASNTNLYNITLEDETLESVLEFFSKISGVGIIANTDDLYETVTLKLTDVEWRPALEAILEMHNLMLVQRLSNTNVLYVVQEPPGTEPYEYEYTLADTIYECMPSIFLYWLLALLLLNPILAVVTFQKAKQSPKEERILGGPALWAYAVLVGGLPALIIFWWIHKDTKK